VPGARQSNPSGLNHAPLGFEPQPHHRRYQRVRHVLHRRRRLRNSLVQIIYLVPAVALAFALPLFNADPHIEASRIVSLYYSLATGFIALITLLFSLLFLVVPYANTHLTPRLTIFRDKPIVWQSFAFFVAVFVFLAIGGLTLSNDDDVSFVVPLIALLLVLASLGMIRALQIHAYQSLKLGGTLDEIVAAGERVIEVLYRDDLGARPPDRIEMAPVTAEVRWPRRLAMLRQVDVPKLVRFAERADVVVELRVMIGTEVRHDVVVAAVHGDAGSNDPAELIGMVDAGPDRSFDQDPLFAFRLLVDIALRALSTAVNDPITAVQAIGCVHELLHRLLRRDLDIGRITSTDGRLRVVLDVPTWEDFLALTFDELNAYIGASPQARRRLTEMMDDLLAGAPAERRPALEARWPVIAT
jgi:uncharacterized membrane protein